MLIIFYWVANNSKFLTDKWRFDKTDPHCSIALSKSNVFLLIFLQINDKFHCQESIIDIRCPLTRERKQKKNPIFIFKSVRVRLRDCVRLRECVNTEFDWEGKRGFEETSVSRAVRLRECPLAES